MEARQARHRSFNAIDNDKQIHRRRRRERTQHTVQYTYVYTNRCINLASLLWLCSYLTQARSWGDIKWWRIARWHTEKFFLLVYCSYVCVKVDRDEPTTIGLISCFLYLSNYIIRFFDWQQNLPTKSQRSFCCPPAEHLFSINFPSVKISRSLRVLYLHYLLSFLLDEFLSFFSEFDRSSPHR